MHLESLKGEEGESSTKIKMMTSTKDAESWITKIKLAIPTKLPSLGQDVYLNTSANVSAEEGDVQFDPLSFKGTPPGQGMTLNQLFGVHVEHLKSKKWPEHNKSNFCISMTSLVGSSIKMPPVLCAPSYSVIGFPKTGSSSVWGYMGQHPNIRVYFKKEAHFFHRKKDEIYEATAWFGYLKGYQRVNNDDIRGGVIFGDHTPGYIWRIPWYCKKGRDTFGCAGLQRRYPLNHTAVMMRRLVPRITLVILIRNPIERMYSHFYHFYDPKSCPGSKRNADCFHGSYLGEIGGAFKKCVAKHGKWHPLCAWGPVDTFAFHQHSRGFSLGLYAVFISLWLDLYPKKQFCVLDLEHLKAGLTTGLGMIEDCLGLPRLPSYQAVAINRRGTVKRAEPMQNRSVAILQEWYEPYNRRLCAMQLHPLKCNTSWLSKYEREDGFHLEIREEEKKQQARDKLRH